MSARGLREISFTRSPRLPYVSVQVKAQDWPHLSGYGGDLTPGPYEVVVGVDSTLGGCARVAFQPSECRVVSRISQQIQKIRCRRL